MAADVSFLPVPVAINRKVRKAFNAPPFSHRSAQFKTLFTETREMLLAMTGATGVELPLGSGTVANDMVAGQLGLLDCRGIVLVNGEFGERLADHAARHNLRFDTIRFPWGTPFDYAAIEETVAHGTVGWLWAVHCETFTGTLNDVARFEEICVRHGVRLCLDCISTVGVVPVRLDKVHLASTVSGKGLGAYPGVAIVFYNHEPAENHRLPRYLDLGHYRAKGGVPFTHSSNLISALREALDAIHRQPKYERIRKESDWLRRGLREAGIKVPSSVAGTSPAVLTLAIPPAVSSLKIGEELERNGFLIGYRTEFLARNNWLRICLFGDTGRIHHRKLLKCIVEIYEREHAINRPDEGRS